MIPRGILQDYVEDDLRDPSGWSLGMIHQGYHQDGGIMLGIIVGCHPLQG